jgi:probable F420-dependent oxidoreductase
VTELGSIGVWSPRLRGTDPSEAAEAAAELEEIGYGAIWVPGHAPNDLEDRLRVLLASTKRIAVATGILDIWTHPPATTAAVRARVVSDFGERFVLGVGVGHAPLLGPGVYQRPLSAMVRYLDELDTAAEPVPQAARVVAALAPRMLELARTRSLGSHPYLVTPDHIRLSRELLGPGPLLAPEQTVILERDPERARTLARDWLALYWTLPNYLASFRRIGFGWGDFRDGGSDRLVDALIAWGDIEAIVTRVNEHRAAGADHLALQVVTRDPTCLPREEWRQIAAALR